MTKIRGLFAGLWVLALTIVPALAQTEYPDANNTTRSIGTVVQEYVNPSGNAVPDSAATPHPVTCISGCAGAVLPLPGPGAIISSVSNTSSNVQLTGSTSTYPAVQLKNNGLVDLFYNFGTTIAVTATTGATATKLPAGMSIILGVGSNTYVAAITSTGTTELDVTQLTASAAIAGGGSGSGGGGLSIAFGGAIGANGTPIGFKDGSGNLQPFLGDTVNGAWVNVKASTGTASGTAASGATGAAVLCSTTTAIAGGSNGNLDWINCTPAGALRSDLYSVGGTALGAIVNYGSTPTAVPALSTNTFITNTVAANFTQVLGAAISATNGLFSNTLQGNAVLSVTNPTFSTPVPYASGGMSLNFLQPTASTNSTSVKASAGQVYWILAENNSATVNYLRFYNTSSTPTCSSATSFLFQVQIPANTAVGGISIPLPFGAAFSTGIGYCVTSGYATNDATNATPTAISLTIGYD